MTVSVTTRSSVGTYVCIACCAPVGLQNEKIIYMRTCHEVTSYEVSGAGPGVAAGVRAAAHAGRRHVRTAFTGYGRVVYNLPRGITWRGGVLLL